MGDADYAEGSLRPFRARIYETHVTAEGIEAHWTENEKKALGVLYTGFMTVTAKAIIKKLKEVEDAN